MSAYHMYARHLWRTEEGAEYPGTGVKDDHELLCGCLEPNSGPPQEQEVLLTVEPSLQLLDLNYCVAVISEGKEKLTVAF